MDATSMLMKVRDALNEATSTTWADSVNEARETVTEAVESGEGGVWDELDTLLAYITQFNWDAVVREAQAKVEEALR